MFTIAGGVFLGLIGFCIVGAIIAVIFQRSEAESARRIYQEIALRDRPERERQKREWDEQNERERDLEDERRKLELLGRPERHSRLERIAHGCREKRLATTATALVTGPIDSGENLQ